MKYIKFVSVIHNVGFMYNRFGARRTMKIVRFFLF